MLSVVKKWYNGIPPAERNLPTLIVDDKAYTPNEVMNEVRRGTQLGKKMQQTVVGGMTSLQKLERLAKTRVLAWLKKLPSEFGAVNVQGETYSRDELIAAVKQQENIGKTLVEEEIQKIKERMRLK